MQILLAHLLWQQDLRPAIDTLSRAPAAHALRLMASTPDAAMASTYEKLALRVGARLTAEKTADCLWIAIGGGPGAGKSTLAAAVAERVNDAHPGSCVVLPMDGFHYSRAQLRELDPPDATEYLRRRGAPWTVRASRSPNTLLDLATRLTRHMRTGSLMGGAARGAARGQGQGESRDGHSKGDSRRGASRNACVVASAPMCRSPSCQDPCHPSRLPEDSEDGCARQMGREV